VLQGAKKERLPNQTNPRWRKDYEEGWGSPGDLEKKVGEHVAEPESKDRKSRKGKNPPQQRKAEIRGCSEQKSFSSSGRLGGLHSRKGPTSTVKPSIFMFS